MKMSTDLFSAGYRCKLVSADLLITGPARQQYRVSLAQSTCTCPAGLHGTHCKHRENAKGLALAQCHELWLQSGLLSDTADLHRFYTQWGGVMGYKAEGQRLLHEAKMLRDAATALYEWAHTGVSAVQAVRIAA